MKYPKRSQYKYAKQKKYRRGNWGAYNDALRRQGDLTIWFGDDAIGNWEADKTGKPGGQKKYSELASETALVVRVIYKLAYRQTQGFLNSIASLLTLSIEIPDYSTLYIRAIETHGRRQWYKSSGFSQRSMVDSTVYRYKQIIGPEMRADKPNKPAFPGNGQVWRTWCGGR